MNGLVSRATHHSFLLLLHRAEEEKPYDHKRCYRREPGGDTEPETVREHDRPQHQDRIHRPVFEVTEFPDLVDAPDGKFPYYECPDTVSYQDKRDREGESKRPDDSIDRERCIKYLEVGKFRIRIGLIPAILMVGYSPSTERYRYTWCI